jgi:hypothetical protein
MCIGYSKPTRRTNADAKWARIYWSWPTWHARISLEESKCVSRKLRIDSFRNGSRNQDILNSKQYYWTLRQYILLLVHPNYVTKLNLYLTQNTYTLITKKVFHDWVWKWQNFMYAQHSQTHKYHVRKVKSSEMLKEVGLRIKRNVHSHWKVRLYCR